MNKNLISYLILFLTSITVLYSVGYHTAEDIGSGTFNGNFIFEGNVDFGNADILAGSFEGFPIGTILPFAGVSVPSNWLECDGSNLSRVSYSELYVLINTTYGPGDGSSTFNLPDLRGEFIRGLDDGRGIDSGRILGSTQNDQFQDHTHSVSHNLITYIYVYTGHWRAIARRWHAGAVSITVGAPNSGNYGAETRPRNIAMKYIIKTK